MRFLKYNKISFTALTLFISFITLSAAEVGKINFNQTGALKRSKEYLSLNLSLQPGGKFSQEKLNNDIKRLKETGYFTDVEAVVEKPSKDIVDITFNLATTSRIADIVIEGNKKFSKEELLEHIPLHPGESLNEKRLKRSLSNLQNLYIDSGYYDVKIYPRTQAAANGDVTVTFRISENLKLKVNSVNFIGNTVFSRSELKDTIQTHYSYFNLLSSIDFAGLLDKYFNMGLYSKSEIEKDKIRLRNLYWTKGYLDFSVNVKTEPEKEKLEFLNVFFEINEGKPYKIGVITIEGNTTFKTKDLYNLLLIKSGETYNYQKEQESVQAITGRYDRLGYCDFKCRPAIDADYQNHVVDITFLINEGRIYTVRNVNITGNRITKDYVIRRELPVQPGQPVDDVLINAGKSRLMAMNYFKNVEVYTNASGVPGEKNVNYKVKEKGTAHVSVGAGWSSSDSLVGRLALSESNFDITDPSSYFRGGGQRIDLLAQIGIERNDLALTFTEPWLFGIPLRLDTTGFWHMREYEYWTEQHLGTSLQLTKPIGEFNTASLGYTLDFVRVLNMSNGYSQSFKKQEEGDSRVGAFNLLLERDTRDSLMNPTSGYRLSLGGEVNSVIFAGSSNYYKVDLSASGYWNFFDKFLVLHLGAKYGLVGGIGGNGDVPIYKRYFLGGQNSIRGFQYRKVSPLNNNGLPLGGQSMFVTTAEITHPIYKWIKGAAFVDVGNAWASSTGFNFNWNVGVGYGLRILIPQISSTPIRLDLGIPVARSNAAYSATPQFYFDVGVNW